MAYITGNLNEVMSTLGGAAPRLWFYLNADADSDTTLVGASFFSDAVSKGMKVGDLIDAVNVGTAKYKRYQCASVSGVAATVAAPTAIT